MLRQLVKNVAQQSVIIVAAMIVLGFVNLFYYWSMIDHQFLLIWVGAVVIINMFRLIMTMVFFQNSVESLSSDSWLNIFAGISVMSGLSWSAFAIYANHNLSLQDCNLVFLSIVGMAGGAIATNSSSARVFLSYIAATMLPICIDLVLSPTMAHLIVGIGGLLGMLFLVTSFLQVNSVIKRSILSGIENKSLLKDLQQRQDEIIALNNKLLELSSTDSLTELYNRRIFDGLLESEWKIAHNHDNPLSLILLDIDCFKLYNDSNGHQAGDECLKLVASILQRAARSRDVRVSRYGGEEFAVILPEMDIDSAETLAIEMKHAISSSRIDHPHSTVSDVVTISAGVATMKPNGSGGRDRLISLADAALYRAKKTGRNKVVRGFYSDDI